MKELCSSSSTGWQPCIFWTGFSQVSNLETIRWISLKWVWLGLSCAKCSHLFQTDGPNDAVIDVMFLLTRWPFDPSCRDDARKSRSPTWQWASHLGASYLVFDYLTVWRLYPSLWGPLKAKQYPPSASCGGFRFRFQKWRWHNLWQSSSR